MLNKIIESCRYLLNNYSEARECREYLDARINKDSQELFQFGYFPGSQHLSVLKDLVGEDLLLKEKLFYTREIEDSLYPRKIDVLHFENHPLIIPFCDTYGDVVALVGRSLLNDYEMKTLKIDKYKNTRDFKKDHFLFGLYENKQSIIDKGCVYVVEGQFDVIKAVEKGLKNIVALGTSNMSIYQFSLISRYTDNIFLLLDNDEAGQKGRKLVINKFGKLANIQNCYIIEKYKDIDEYLTKSNDEFMSFVFRT